MAYSSITDHISTKITTLEPMITGLQQALPKSICLLPFDCGVTGCVRLVKELLKLQFKAELKTEILHGIKEVGSALYWMGSPPTLFHLLFSITARRFSNTIN
ncbi:putative cytoplasmic FMR1-interacting [Helianthus annuus]|uniref:Cytoplasmic FMR1-interacting n=1 Tax=Helianthus annuus TaxID=4232 RepID=A0A9K3HCV1_HELAN|nr:putative cytoplasmic FMR1-interacting [Helianthus annuus]